MTLKSVTASLFLGAMFAPVASMAASPKLGEVFRDVTYAQPKCYGREYSKAELKAHPQQTVAQIKAKFMKYSSDPVTPSHGLKIEVRLKGEQGLNYHGEFSCMSLKGQVHCAIECDGGSVTIAQFDAKTATIKNNGFVIHGGCDGAENEVIKFLKATKGGDDVFKLDALPAAFCSDATTDAATDEAATAGEAPAN